MGNIPRIRRSQAKPSFFHWLPDGHLTLEVLSFSLTLSLEQVSSNLFLAPRWPGNDSGYCSAVSPPQSEAYIITTKGPDRKGLVAGISEVIARFEGNITNLQAVFKGGEEPGDNIMIYEVDVPPRMDQQILYRELKKRATELKLDIDIQHRNIFEAIHRI